MTKLIEICKDYPLFEVLNRDKTIIWGKTEKMTRKHLMHFVHFMLPDIAAAAAAFVLADDR